MSEDHSEKCYRSPSAGKCKCDKKGSQKPLFDLKTLKALVTKPSPGLIAAGLFTGVVLFDTVLKGFVFGPEPCDCGCCYIREREKELKRRAILKEKQCLANLIIAEQKRKAAEAKKKAAEEAKKREAEAKKKEAEAKRKEAEAKKKAAEEAKKKAAEEAKKKAAEEAKKKAAVEAKKKAAEEAKKKEAEAKKRDACKQK